jgi:hypothetical protein
MSDLPKANTTDELLSLHGKPVPVAVFARMVERNRKTVYRRIERGTLPACYVGGQLCVLVNGESPRLGPTAPLPSRTN